MSFEGMNFSAAKKPLGISVAWSEQEAEEGKKVYLGDSFTGELMGRDEWNNGERDLTIYRIKLEDGRVVSVWETSVIRSAMEEGGPDGGPVPEGAIVRFTHEGMKQPQQRGRKPYHNVRVEYAIPTPAFKAAGGLQGKPSQGVTLASKGQVASNQQAEDSGY